MLERALPFLLLLAGCPDPTAAPDGSAAGQPMGGVAGGPPPGGDGSQAGPPAGGEAGVPAGRPTPPGFQVAAGAGVKLSGTLTYDGSKTGAITIDFLKNTQGSNFPELVHSITLEKPGPWEVEAPKDSGEFWIVSFIDANGNGPDRTEPAGRVMDAVKVGAEPISGLDIRLMDEPDLGELKPGEPAAGTPGAGAAPGSLPPVQGAPGTAPAGAAPAGEAPAGAPPAGEAAPTGQ